MFGALAASAALENVAIAKSEKVRKVRKSRGHEWGRSKKNAQPHPISADQQRIAYWAGFKRKLQTDGERKKTARDTTTEPPSTDRPRKDMPDTTQTQKTDDETKGPPTRHAPKAKEQPGNPQPHQT